ncbi:MAG: glycosyltransferase family 25 protein [Acidobacteriota bacterium]|jgi:glycosyl transferase family 25|nr:glycosyltransferase family 25 protein [Acidobacteriota bacterium]
MLPCYIINLDRAKDRWDACSGRFARCGFDVVRVAAVDGGALSAGELGDFARRRYFFFYGRPVAAGEIGCYFSHIKALKAFLATGEESAMVCEDDVSPAEELPEVLRECLRPRHRGMWDLLRLNAIHPTRGRTVAQLCHGYRLVRDVRTASGDGCFVVNRRAAGLIVEHMLPMRLPYDVALFYGFPFGVREMTVHPFPVALDAALCGETTITGRKGRYPLLSLASLRYPVLLPYKLVSRSVRLLERLRQAYFL